MTELRYRLYVIVGKSRTGKTKIAKRVQACHESLQILQTDRFRPNGNDELAWRNIVSHLTKARFTSDVLIEGVAITPKKVHELSLDEFVVHKVVFLGYGSASHADTILTHARSNPESDWVSGQLRINPHYENDVREWMRTGIPESAEMKNEAEAFGYGYFDITDYSTFEEYAKAVAAYLSVGSATD